VNCLLQREFLGVFTNSIVVSQKLFAATHMPGRHGVYIQFAPHLASIHRRGPMPTDGGSMP